MQRAMRSRSLSICLTALALAMPALAAAGCHRRHEAGEQRGAAATPGGARAPVGAAATSATSARTARPAENLACKLLTRDDAEALFGEAPLATPVTSVTADIGVIAWRCGYLSEHKSPPGPNGATKVVTLLVKHWQEPAAARSAYEHAHALSQTVSGEVPETISGLGERAYWAGGMVNQLNVLVGSDWLVISGTQGPGLDELGPAKAAAARILAHR